MINGSVGTCLQCPTEFCTICDRDDPSICHQCKYPEYRYDSQTATCVLNCKNGQYDKPETYTDPFEGLLNRWVCAPCGGNSCYTCDDLNSGGGTYDRCTSCLPGLSIVQTNDACRAVCPSGEYSDPVPSTQYFRC